MARQRSIQSVLITGVTGSAGSYMAEHLLEEHPHLDVHGLARTRSGRAQRDDDPLSNVEIHESDLNDLSSVIRVLREAEPDGILHLASNANVRASFRTPNAVLQNNVACASNMLEAVRLTDQDPAIQICSTSEVYGFVEPEDVPIDEDTPIRPANPYAVSKVAQDMLGSVYHEAYGMDVIRTRMFGYINPRRPNLFASAFAKRVALAEKGLIDVVTHGNLDSVRALIDVRDAVRAYWEALIRCEPGEAYNIGGTEGVRVGDVLDKLVELADGPIETQVDEDLLRPTDVTLQIPDVSKFQRTTGWEPKYSLDESIQFLLTHWRRQAELELARREAEPEEVAA